MIIRLVCVLLIGTLEGYAPGTPLRLAVSPLFSASPGAFRATAIVEPHAENRWLVLRAESTDYYRSSTIQLFGARAARRHEMFFERLPSGQYLIEARIERTNGDRIVTDAVVHVIDPRGRQ
jgi:hypothetical protein